MRRYLVAGLLLWLPLGVTVLVLKVLLDLMDRSLLLIPAAYRPENLLGFNIPGLGVLLTFAVLLLTGMLVANLFGRKLVHWWETALSRIPLIRSVYSSAKQLAETLLADNSQSFKKVMLIEYPRKGVWGLGFQTSDYPGEIQERTGRDLVCVFVPTTPNPTSGFLLMVPRDEVIELDMDVEEGLRMIISLGVVVPVWRGHAPPVELATPRTTP